MRVLVTGSAGFIGFHVAARLMARGDAVTGFDVVNDYYDPGLKEARLAELDRIDRPPRAYRGRDFCWWLGVLGKWDAETPGPGTEHVTIAVSGAHGGQTVDFRRLAEQGMTLVGRTEAYRDGVMSFARDLAENIARGDANYLSLLDEADAYVIRNGLDLAEEPEARGIGPDPACVADPILELNLAEAGVTSIIWATGFALDYGWLKIDAFDEKGRPRHQRGVSVEPGIDRRACRSCP